jgi:hypothetical protein
MTKILLLVILGLVLPSNSQAAPNFLPSKWTTGNLVLTGITGYLGYKAWYHHSRWKATHKNLLTEHGCSKYEPLEMDKYCQKVHDLTGEGDEDAERVPLYAISAMMVATIGYAVWNAYWATVTKKKKYSKLNLTVTRDSAIVSLKLDF